MNLLPAPKLKKMMFFVSSPKCLSTYDVAENGQNNVHPDDEGEGAVEDLHESLVVFEGGSEGNGQPDSFCSVKGQAEELEHSFEIGVGETLRQVYVGLHDEFQVLGSD